MNSGKAPLSWTRGDTTGLAIRRKKYRNHRIHDMNEHHCQGDGHPAGKHALSARVYPAGVSFNHESVKPDVSWHVPSTFTTTYRTTGFSKTGKRPRGATS